MRTDTTVKVEATLTVYTCGCGMVYAIPSWLLHHQCPACAERRIQEQLQENAGITEQTIALENTIRSLRGALTKAKKRR